MNTPINIAFTTNFGDYDNLPMPYVAGKSWYKVLFTDSDKAQKKGWDKVVVLPKTDRPDLDAKLIKWGIHNYFKDAQWFLHYDGNMVIKKHIEPQLIRIIHQKRKSVLEECHACNAQVHRWSPQSINEQYQAMVEDGYQDDNGLFLNGFFCRPNTEIENKIGDEVCEMLKKYTTRDQIAFPYILWKNNYGYQRNELKTFHYFVENITLLRHKQLKPSILTNIKEEVIELPPLPKKIKIYSFTPFDSDKNFGKACNDHCALVPNDEDWILLRDSDTTFLTPDFPQQIQSIVDRYHNDFDLISCYTNRLGLKYQLYGGDISENTEIKHHIEIAKKLHEEKFDKVAKLNKNVAGFFLLFSKKAWKEHPFEEGLLVTKKDYDGKEKSGYIDYWFSNYFARKKRVGIALGLYVFHVYRLFNKSRLDQNHLRD
ncbi:MAG: Cellulophaga phage phi17:1 [Bacteroidota bacterium]|jgi:hypothetical protein